MKTKQVLSIAFLFLLLDVIATGLFTAIILHLLVIEDWPKHINRTTEDVLFGSGLLTLLSPAYILAAPILGYCSDIFGRKPLLLVTVTCDCLGYTFCLGSLFASSIFMLLIGLTLLGIGNSNLCLTLAISADTTHNKTKVFIFAIIAFATNVLVIATHIGNQILENFNYSTASYQVLLSILIVIELINIILISVFLPETNSKLNKQANFSIDDNFKALTLLLSKKQTRFLLAIFILFEFAAGLYNQNIFVYLTTVLHFSMYNASLFVDYRTLIMLLSLLTIYPLLIYYLSLKQLLVCCFALAVIGLLGASLLQINLAQWIFCLLIASGFAMLEPTLWVMLSNCASRNYQGLIFGIVNSLWLIGWLISGAAGDKLITHYAAPLWIAFGVLAMTICMLCYKIIKEKRAVTC